MSAGQAACADVTVTGDEVVITPRGWWKVSSMRGRVRVPRDAVRGARLSQDPVAELRPRWRTLGTYLFVIRAGYWRGRSGSSWWCYRTGRPALVLDLDPELAGLDEIVAVTDDAPGTVAALGGTA